MPICWFRAILLRISQRTRPQHWQSLDGQFSSVCTAGDGRPPLPTRLLAGLFIRKHMHGLSDEVLCARWLENPCYQFFCGELSFCHALPFNRLSLTHWRQRRCRPCSPTPFEIGRSAMVQIVRRSSRPGSAAPFDRRHKTGVGQRARGEIGLASVTAAELDPHTGRQEYAVPNLNARAKWGSFSRSTRWNL